MAFECSVPGHPLGELGEGYVQFRVFQGPVAFGMLAFPAQSVLRQPLLELGSAVEDTTQLERFESLTFKYFSGFPLMPMVM